MAIISASRRTDIPAFFTPWFMQRIREGHFCRINPFNPRQVKDTSLAPEDVDAIVFWSKQPRPLMEHLDELDGRGYCYYFQFTLNPYDSIFEPHLPPFAERVATFQQLAARVGADKVIWRYDPVILSSVTPVEWHLERLAEIAAQLAGSTQRLIFSLLDFYGTVNKRLQEIEKRHAIQLFDIAATDREADLLRFATGLQRIAARHGMAVLSCAEAAELQELGIGHGSCIDGNLINSLLGSDEAFARDRNQRQECLCVKSVDMGMYNTCSFNCAYCYANRNERLIRTNLGKHDPHGAAIVKTAVSSG